MISAEEWYKTFVEEFVKAAMNPELDIGVHYRNYKMLGEETPTEWTYHMGVFLARMSHKLNCCQEHTILDFLWYENGGGEDPVAAIEHENEYAGICSEEIPKLLVSKAPLRIMITYTDGTTTEAIRKEAGDCIRSRTLRNQKPFEFLLIIGGYLDKPNEWVGYLWDMKWKEWISIE